MSDEISNLLELTKTLATDVKFLRQMVFLQSAQIAALTAYAGTKLAQIQGITKEEAHEAIESLTRVVYDKRLLSLGDTHPDYAASADIREILESKDRPKWIFPDDPSLW